MTKIRSNIRHLLNLILFHNQDGEAEETKLRPDGITVHIPDIGSTLPVFVWDNYPAFESVVEFPKLNFGKLQNYLLKNSLGENSLENSQTIYGQNIN